MDVLIKQDDLNQKFLTSLAPEWLVYTIVWRNKDDLDTMSLDDMYNYLKVYEPEVRKRVGSNSQNMAFISSSNTSSGKSKLPTVQGVSTVSAQVSTDNTDVAAASLSYDTIDDDDIEEMDMNWNLALLSMGADRMSHLAKECRSPRSQDKGKSERYKKDPKVEEPTPKAMIAIDVIGCDWSYMAKEDGASKNHALVAGFTEYCVVPPSPAQVYSPPKKDLSWMGLPEFVDDTVTDYTRPTPSIDVSKSVSKELEERWKSNNPSFFKQGGSSGNVVSKLMIKFVKESACSNATKVYNTKNARKPTVKYVDMYRNTSQSPRVRGNQRNWNNPKSQQLGRDFMMQNKACYNCVEDMCHLVMKEERLLNDVPERRNRTLIEATRTMLANDKLPVTFWAEARVLVIKPYNKTRYELFNKRSHAIGFLRPFGCHVIILNTLDHLGKFDAEGDEGYFVGYSLSSKAFRVFNKITKKIEENLHVDFLENRSIEKGTRTSSTNILGTKEDVHQAVKEKESPLRFIALPNWFHEAQTETSNEAAKKDDAIPDNNAPQKEQEKVNGDKEVPESSGNLNPTANTKVSSNDLFELASSSIVEIEVPTVSTPVPTGNAMSFEKSLEDFFGDTSNAVSLNNVEADLRNMETAIQVSPTPTLRIHKDHPKSFIVYQMVVKSAFLYGAINEEVYLMQPLVFQDLKFPHRVYKVEMPMYGLHQAPRAWYDTLSKYLLYNGFQKGELNFFLGLQVLQKKDDIFLSQDKYVGDILTKFGYRYIRSAKTPTDIENPWGKDGTGKYVELDLYRSMIGSLMYLTASRPDIMFVVCACARYQVTTKECHLHAVKRIFRYAKGHPKLGLWYPKESPFDLVAYSDSDYGGANQDRKSTTGGCQFLGRRLISWQCIK
nr:uncharacterized mitochondrial protein AtMg00810-like [Tanacetum cinerariifolium]